ncbi:MAG: hypothetical protein NZM31_08775 [Gemmatales bacterium]|nr:hypothetical protein [Gemmatales bacterium]MDW8387086.1 hypothetical protein [Gemmatales bacterium]
MNVPELSATDFARIQAVLSYLNLSTGRPDAKFRRHLADLYDLLARSGKQRIWLELRNLLAHQLGHLRQSGSPVFSNCTQAEAVLELAFEKLPQAYRRHHADLLFHWNDDDLFQPFFLARMCEAVLRQEGPWEETEQIVSQALRELNDFVGYRPIPVLETRWTGEIYDHERVCPIPLYFRGVGVAPGRLAAVLDNCISILQQTDSSILQEAGFDLEAVDEIALDPRAYDHSHPANRRPNHIFGEWDPHRLDKHGRFCRFVARDVVLEGLLRYIAGGSTSERSREELLFEASTVLAGTMLMASAITGSGPNAYDSSVTLATLIPRIAANREAFYRFWLDRVSGGHGERLRQEAQRMRQPFAQVRQFLNHFVAVHRADQLQRRHLAILFAGMGYPEESRRFAHAIPTASSRILCEIIVRLTLGMKHAEAGQLEEAAAVLPEIEDLIRRGIRCGALVDPWNVLGFAGHFPLFSAAEDSIPDPRIEDLTRVMELLFTLYARILGDAAATGRHALRKELTPRMRALAEWWDQFGTCEVNSVPHVRGKAAADSADHVGAALARWHDRGEATTDLAFWRQHVKAFQSPKAFALVVDALLERRDLRAAMALLMSWLSQSAFVPLEEGEFSFFGLALRWLLTALSTSEAEETARTNPAPNLELVKKFFDYLEANAEELWSVPRLEEGDQQFLAESEEDEDSEEASEVDESYQDTAEDGTEGALAEAGAKPDAEFPLESRQEGIARHLKFLDVVARLWQITARFSLRRQDPVPWRDSFGDWLKTAQHFQQELHDFLGALHRLPIPDPLGSTESMIEYDRRRAIKDQLLDMGIGTALNLTLAIRALIAAVRQSSVATSPETFQQTTGWELLAIDLHHALLRRDPAAVQALLPAFVREISGRPLLYVPLDAGGKPEQILQAKLVQTTLRLLIEGLPRIGLLREAFHLLRLARDMERIKPTAGKRVTEFDRLFFSGLTACVEAVLEASEEWGSSSDVILVNLLEVLSRPFVRLWTEHSQTLRLSVLESIADESEWDGLRQFVRRYGNELFTPRFMTLGNLRGILHRGVGEFLDYWTQQEASEAPSLLTADLEQGRLPRSKAARYLEIVLHAVSENYDIYRDYNTTTPQSDFGENLHILLDFLRLRVNYERYVWLYRPYAHCHEILARRRRWTAAVLWQTAFGALVSARADEMLRELARLESKHGVKLRTISDRLEERFTASLAQDRLCALIEPAMEEARLGKTPETLPRLLREMEPFVARPLGAGLDLPVWLRRLEMEVVRVRTTRTAVNTLAEELDKVPRLSLSLRELQNQLRSWDDPIF